MFTVVAIRKTKPLYVYSGLNSFSVILMAGVTFSVVIFGQIKTNKIISTNVFCK